MSRLTDAEAKEHFGHVSHYKLQYKRKCDGCGKIMDTTQMVTVQAASTRREGDSDGVHLCRKCAAAMTRRYLEANWADAKSPLEKRIALKHVIDYLARTKVKAKAKPKAENKVEEFKEEFSKQLGK